MNEEIKEESPKRVPILTISALEGKEGRWNPSLVMSDSMGVGVDPNIEITPMFVAGACVLVYRWFEEFVPEDRKVEVIEDFFKVFTSMLIHRNEYSSVVTTNNNLKESEES
jgi:hypothetical protein